MITSLQKKVSQMDEAIKSMLNNEICFDGLLSDVEEIYVGERINKFDYPSIWIIQESIEPQVRSLGARSIEEDTAIYQFYALDFDKDDPETAYELSKDLALRIGDTLEKHCLIKDCNTQEKVFDSVSFVSLEPTGNPSGAANGISQACIRYEFKFSRQRNFCANSNMNNNNNSNNEEEE